MKKVTVQGGKIIQELVLGFSETKKFYVQDAKSKEISIYNTPLENLNIPDEQSVKILDLDDVNLMLKDIEEYSALEFLSYISNEKDSQQRQSVGSYQIFDGNRYPALTELILDGCDIQAINLSVLNGLQSLCLSRLEVSGQDLSKLNGLESLDLHSMEFAGLDLSGLNGLKRLYLDSMELTSLDLSVYPDLEKAFFSSTCVIQELNVSGLQNIKSIFGGDYERNGIATNPIKKIIVSQSISSEDLQYLQEETAKYDWSKELSENPGMDTSVEFVYVP